MFRLGFFHFTFYFWRYYFCCLQILSPLTHRSPSADLCWYLYIYVCEYIMYVCMYVSLVTNDDAMRCCAISTYCHNFAISIYKRKSIALSGHEERDYAVLIHQSIATHPSSCAAPTTYAIYSSISDRKISWKFFFSLDSFSFAIWFFKGETEPSPPVWHISNWYLTSMMKWMPINCLQTKALTNVWIYKMYNRVCVYAWIHFSWMYSLRFIRFVLWTIW